MIGKDLSAWMLDRRGRRAGRIRLAGLAAFGVMALVGATAEQCDANGSLVVVKYQQIGGCQGIPGTYAGAGAAYVAFRIVAIENTGTNAREFDFDPDRLYVNTDPRADVKSSYAQSLHLPFITYGKKVAAGTTARDLGDVMAIVPNPIITITDPAHAKGQIESFTLLHTTPGGTQGVVMSRQDAQETYPYSGDCQGLTY